MVLLITAIMTATYYDDWFTDKITASGMIFNQNHMICASNRYKLGSKLEITNSKNNKKVIVIVKDRCRNCYENIDLSKRAFLKLDVLSKGIINIKVKEIK